MWLTSSSIGRKFVMAITGICLVLFVTFHCLMNSVALLWPAAYNVICQFLGANWYALVASAGLAFLFIMHIIYALWLTIQNRRARGADRYAVSSRPPQVEWSSKNMYILGLVVLAFLVLHLVHFWAKMQLVELIGDHTNSLGYSPADGAALIRYTFSKWYFVVPYLVWFFALWFHLTHGVWSMFQTAGWANDTWYPRLKCIANVVATLVFAGFAVVVLVYFFCPCLREAAMATTAVSGAAEAVEAAAGCCAGC